jgi:hypothetical protein
MSFPELLGGGVGHHAVAHHQNSASSIERLQRMNRVHAGLLAAVLDGERNAETAKPRKRR